MEVILKQDIKNLGEKDDVVNVKPGYGRNFLIPQGFAILATTSSRKVLAENLKQAQFKQEKIRKDADAIATRLEGVTLTIGAKAGETGKIFGSINTIQIADALKKEGFEVDRRRITFDAEPKFVGDYTANLNLHKEVKVKVPFTVVAE
ncbi:large subunit ribosomal protein L9 [Mucilaginibacter gracilis]|uniref:Large ribosomal subunit protein bL9 n=1 Tax=Mucilaginibacter gracilis TaxID=423350 RepID=A0A495IVZ2_9SPHI|nr:50S ribosomal protein L9 [Mucilaginibacter gracilis]RKR80029.1 large subunit ribosomal protein L9 [Mucilaginibacter gracilis]